MKFKSRSLNRRAAVHPYGNAILMFAVLLAAVSPSHADELPPAASRRVDFKTDIKPLIDEHCIRCHNPEKKKGGLRLDAGPLALAGGLSGRVIVPGDSASSILIHNIAGLGDAYLMPPEGDMLSEEAVGLFRAWIDQGAEWPDEGKVAQEEKHWAFVPPVRPPLPPLSRRTALAESDNPIDRFIAARLEAEGLTPSPPAAPETLLRRMSLDLTGLPPSVAELDEFMEGGDASAGKIADRLLASPRYGERWARWWLDAARYADTNGYEKDRERSMWPWRDWVIGAFNENKPFDQFTIGQLAGDLLPGATQDQKIATGFHRNTMINEEGGVDVEQFRYESVVDRVGTTATVFLGLTLACAQCHNHKYDPISQREFYQVFAFLNDADEPVMPVPDPAITWERIKRQREIDRVIAELPEKFPARGAETDWEPMRPLNFSSAQGAMIELAGGDTLRIGGHRPAKDETTILAAIPEAFAGGRIGFIAVEALADPELPGGGPGRADNGNFVLSGINVRLIPGDGGESIPLALADPSADFDQAGFALADAIDENPAGGWGIAPQTGRTHRASFRLAGPPEAAPGARLLIRLRQEHGAFHTLGRVRLLAGRTRPDPYPADLTEEERRARHLEARFGEWLREVAADSSDWTVPRPLEVKSAGGATMTLLEDRSILVSGDSPNRDVYSVEIAGNGTRVTALRIEALPHDSLPESGPGRDPVYQPGNFQLNEVTVERLDSSGSAGPPLPLSRCTASFEQANQGAALAIDGDRATGWSVHGGQGEEHALVIELAEPVELRGDARIRVTLDQNFIHQETLGRFRVSVTGDEAPVVASGLTADLEIAARAAEPDRTEEQRASLMNRFLLTAPELAAEQKRIDRMIKALPDHPTTLVMQGRGEPRTTRIHHRGEYLNPGEEVSPGVPAILHAMESAPEPGRLQFARWITDRRNPLTARVIMNRFWQEIFGAGLVRTSEDFGTRGEPPTHPGLLDWLAVEFMESGWDVKHMLRLIVTSETYAQASDITPELLERDPENRLLARGPRFRVTAEMVRDVALRASGLLSDEIGGPSVFPPQPPGVSELSYGPMKWNESKGEDRYRRGLYTFMKRTSPYPMLTLFDAPLSDTACVRRVRSNTPLQSLTLLNDEVFVEASRALASRVLAEADDDAGRVNRLFRRVLSREAEPEETERILAFVAVQRERIAGGALDARKITGAESPASDAAAHAAWTTAARAILNLDETVTKE